MQKIEAREYGVRAFETVFKGPEIKFNDGEKATLAIICWSERPKGRPLVVEFSFRYKIEEKAISATLAREPLSLFELVQRMDWCHPKGVTKPQYIYRSTANE